jgi:hypothetical protein
MEKMKNKTKRRRMLRKERGGNRNNKSKLFFLFEIEWNSILPQ